MTCVRIPQNGMPRRGGDIESPRRDSASLVISGRLSFEYCSAGLSEIVFAAAVFFTIRSPKSDRRRLRGSCCDESITSPKLLVDVRRPRCLVVRVSAMTIVAGFLHRWWSWPVSAHFQAVTSPSSRRCGRCDVCHRSSCGLRDHESQ